MKKGRPLGQILPEPKRKNQSSMSAFFTKKAKGTEPDQNLEEESSAPNTLVEKGKSWILSSASPSNNNCTHSRK